jgi:hypothetical protein
VSSGTAAVSDSTFYLDDPTSAVVVKAFGAGAATATGITRIPAGALYSGDVVEM